MRLVIKNTKNVTICTFRETEALYDRQVGLNGEQRSSIFDSLSQHLCASSREHRVHLSHRIGSHLDLAQEHRFDKTRRLGEECASASLFHRADHLTTNATRGML